MSERQRRKGLGRGLAALMDDIRPEADAVGDGIATATVAPIDRLRPNPEQPRKRFDDAELEALAASIRAKGVVQPLIVRQDPDHDDGFQIVAGERRWRAAQRAQLHELPIIVRSLDDAEVIEIAILENVQRSDLNPIEEASGYAQLIEKFGHTQEKLGDALGKSRSHIANALRLLSLPEEVLAMTREGELTAGHARALVTATDPVSLARTIVSRKLSVREAEALARKSSESTKAPRPEKDPDTSALEADLAAAIGLRVSIQHKGARGGEVRIAYRDLEQLDGICQLLSR